MAGALFIAPATAVFALFTLFPVVAGLGLAFTTWNGYDVDQIRWSGTENFRQLAHDSVFHQALVQTLVFVVFSTLFLNIAGLGAATLVNTRVRGHDFLRIAMFVPIAISPVIGSIIWQRFLSPYGWVNQFLVGQDIVNEPVLFLATPHFALATVITVTIWQYAGFDMLLYYAALQSLPRERIEAAAVDGAGSWARFRYVVIPFLRPVIAVVIVINLIGGWNVFEQVFVLTAGGPDHGTEVLSTWLYQQAFGFTTVGYAAAIAVVITALSGVSALTRKGIAGAPS